MTPAAPILFLARLRIARITSGGGAMEITIRELVDADLDALPRVLNPWFASYLDHLDYTRPVLDFLDHAVWRGRRLGVVAEGERGLAGVVLTGQRAASYRGAPLQALNLSLLAVDPFVRRQGLARRLLGAVGELGRQAGADLIALNTMEIYRSHRVYEACGYRLVERFQALGAGIGEVAPIQGVREVGPETFLRFRPPRAGREGAIVEDPLPPVTTHPAVPLRYWLGGRAGVATALWPVRLRVEGEVQDVLAAQIIDAWGDGVELDATLSTALVEAKEAGADGVIQMPCVQTTPTGMTTEGGSWTLRYAIGLTDAGRAAVGEASAYDEVCPAP
jgi:GNAT superfamily N-acetyltransferase